MPFTLQNWKLIIGGIITLALAATILTFKAQRDNARERVAELTDRLAQETFKLEVSNASIAELERRIEEQNEAFTQLYVEGQRRSDQARKALDQAKREGAEAKALADRLRNAPQTGGDQSRTSDAVMQNRDKL